MLDDKRRVVFFQIIPLLLTSVIAIATCLSTYFSYQTAIISAEQNNREARKEFIQWVTLLRDSIESVTSLKEDIEKEKTDGQISAEESNKSVQPTADAAAD